ncbi:alcohol dehydrogenase catalytic domain-containing protein [Solwaraspora sp. WMMD406]|uniref:alcohol dehydrogenase catalytic domain-containing protein n=1 Tax=Solwaraspora sp. WMMD406 TaxID=3016095 RepID=UPI0024163880|nr:alcohol dehydrogenase catalytic domain-containing protein [Solwaraspora sp. WMMD406]MDG4764573.1 alcohol dehydrogenase catalytic domain-containing protein [Solwaraspora sp. WMMD406]
MTLGHEIAGRVARLGAGVTGWSEGDAVAVYGIIGCGTCRACLRGLENSAAGCRSAESGSAATAGSPTTW